MNPHYTYLLIDAGTIFFPLLFSFDRKVAFYKCWPLLWPGMIITATVFIVWDILFTANGVWWFSQERTLSLRLGGLPLEEWLFFLVVPYSCTFIYATLNAYFPAKGQDAGWKYIVFLAGLLLLLAVLNSTRAYTFFALSGCGTGLLMAYLLRKSATVFRADRFLLAYAVCLIPFLLVNGLLTSLPVVLYNDAENTGVRIYTIPAEDIFYGMLLILGNVWGMSYLAGRRQVKKPVADL